MMRKHIRITTGIAVFFLVGCVLTDSRAEAAGAVRFSTSSQVAEAYGKGIVADFEKMTGLSVQTYVGPSQVAIKRLENGVSDIIAIDQGIPEEMKASGYVEIPFCRDGLAVITNAQCTLDKPCETDNLTEAQLRAVFSGKIKNWKDLGGPDQRIILIVPGRETGAFKNFKEQVMRISEIQFDFITYQATMAVEGVKYIPGAISFVAQGALEEDDQNIKVIKVNGLAPTNKDYPIYQTYSFVTRGEPAGTAKSVINFGLSKHGIDIMRARGMFPVFE